MHTLQLDGLDLQLLPEKAIYSKRLSSLFVSDIHLGKAETFQQVGIPVSAALNQDNLDRLLKLCRRFRPQYLFILGDLFHSEWALAETVVEDWVTFVNAADTEIHLIVGNHDRHLLGDLNHLLMTCYSDGLQLENVVLSHEPFPQQKHLNICGHLHPCVRLKSRLDDLRLPCFYFEKRLNRLTLPSFGAFTGGYEVGLARETVAYAIADDTIVPFEGKQGW